jgi:integral membrane sensor domain MASE1
MLLTLRLMVGVRGEVSGVPREKGQGAAFSFDNLNHSWLGAVELAIAIGVTYFLAARFGLALRVQVGVAIFWPAAGIGVGALIALGPTARLPVAVGVALATIGSSFTIGRNVWLGIAFAFVNAAQALTVSWLIERWFGRQFKLEDVPQVLGFLVACALGAATGASGAAIAVSFVEPTAFPPHVWRIWLPHACWAR